MSLPLSVEMLMELLKMLILSVSHPQVAITAHELDYHMENDKCSLCTLKSTGCRKIYCYLLLLFCTLKIMEIGKVGVKLGFYSSVLHFLKVAMLLFQGRLEKYLLTFGKMRLFVINHVSTVLFFFSQKVRKQKFTTLE